MAQSPFQRTKLGGRPLTDWLLGNKWDLTISEKIFDEHLERQGIAGAVREIARHYRAVHQFEDRDVTIDADPDAVPLQIPTMVNVPRWHPGDKPADVHRVPAAETLPDREPGFDLITYLKQQYAFSVATFGPMDGSGPTTYDSVANHIRKELIEIENSHGRDVFEWIDVIMMGFDGAFRFAEIPDRPGGIIARHAGPQDIAAALQDKLIKNRAREWPSWRTKPRDGRPIEHDRGKEETTSVPFSVLREWRERWQQENAERERLVGEVARLQRERVGDSEKINRLMTENTRLGNTVDTQAQIIGKQVAELGRLQRLLDEQDITIRDLRMALELAKMGKTSAKLEPQRCCPRYEAEGLHAPDCLGWRVNRDVPLDTTIDVRTPPARDVSPAGQTVEQLMNRAGDASYFAPQRRREDTADSGNRDYYGGAHNIYEAIKVITAWGLNFNLGSTVKYILRPGKSLTLQHRVEDLVKAKRYLEFEIARLTPPTGGAMVGANAQQGLRDQTAGRIDRSGSVNQTLPTARPTDADSLKRASVSGVGTSHGGSVSPDVPGAGPSSPPNAPSGDGNKW